MKQNETKATQRRFFCLLICPCLYMSRLQGKAEKGVLAKDMGLIGTKSSNNFKKSKQNKTTPPQ